MSEQCKKNIRRIVFVTCFIVALVFCTILLLLVIKSVGRANAVKKLKESGAKLVYDLRHVKQDFRSALPFSLLFNQEDWAPVWQIATNEKDTNIDLALFAYFPELEDLELYCVSDADLNRLPVLPRVRTMLIECRQLTGSGFAKLHLLEGVETIVFLGTPRAELGFRGVPRLPRLKCIAFWETKLSSIRHLGKQDNVICISIADAINDLPSIDLPSYLSIESLAVSTTELNTSLLDRLSIPGLANLKLTSHGGWQLRDEMSYSRLEGLSQLSNLRSVKLMGFTISSEWLHDFSARNSVERLTLSYCDLDPDFFAELSSWQALKHLELDRVKIPLVTTALRPPLLESLKLIDSELSSLEFLNDPSFQQLQQRTIVRNKELGNNSRAKVVEERPQGDDRSKD